MALFVSAGEASGDAYGAALVEEMRRLAAPITVEEFVLELTESAKASAPLHNPRYSREQAWKFGLTIAVRRAYGSSADVLPVEFDGNPANLPTTLNRLYEMLPEAALGHIKVLAVGGRRLAKIANSLVADSSGWGVISITQALKVVPRILGVSPSVIRKLSSAREPGVNLLVPIDFGYFNVRLARKAKERGWKVLAFVPPRSANKDRQADWAPQIYDAVSTPFEWSAKMLTELGAENVHCFGHPLKQLLRDKIAAGEGSVRLDQIAVLPGSRRHEITHNLPVIAHCLPPTPAEFALAPGSDADAFMRRWRTLSRRRDDRVTIGNTAGVLLRSKAALVCSGTATLEAALCRCPMAVIYQGSRMMYLEAKLLRIKRPQYVALPNILMDSMLVEEFVAHDATPEKIAPYVARLLSDDDLRSKQIAGFEELDRRLGPDDAITQTARLALTMLGRGINAA